MSIEDGEEREQVSPLTAFIAYADRLESLMGARVRPAYVETCTCGASCEIGIDVPARERSRLTNHFIGRHQRCAQQERTCSMPNCVRTDLISQGLCTTHSVLAHNERTP